MASGGGVRRAQGALGRTVRKLRKMSVMKKRSMKTSSDAKVTEGQSIRYATR